MTPQQSNLQPGRHCSLIVTLAMLALSFAPFQFAQASEGALESLSLELSEEARAAVDAGIVLSFTCKYAIRDSWFIFKREREVKQHQFSLARQALSNRYVVTSAGPGRARISRSATEASNYIAAQASKLLESYSTPSTPYSMRISLNKYELPTPIRLKAFIAGAWDIDTGWVKWQSAK